MHIESFFPGRLRVSSPLFTKPENIEQVRALAQSLDGVKDVSGNPRTGSLTVLYDPAIIDEQALMGAGKEIERLEKEMES